MGMDRQVCRECGDTKPLTPSGVCRWRAGCEHRQLRHEAEMGRLNAALAEQERSGRLNLGLVRENVGTNDFAMFHESFRAPFHVDGEWIELEGGSIDGGSWDPVHGWRTFHRCDDPGCDGTPHPLT